MELTNELVDVKGNRIAGERGKWWTNEYLIMYLSVIYFSFSFL